MRAFLLLALLAFGSCAAQAQQPKALNSLDYPGRTLAFRMLAESIPVRDADGRIDAEAGIVAFLREGEGATRPVTFVIGGGPGTASAYLNLGALGPWRISFAASGTRTLVAERRHLARFHRSGLCRSARHRDWATGRQTMPNPRSVSGRSTVTSICLTDAIASWLRKHDRVASPKTLVAQSYGGLRAPRIAESLHRRARPFVSFADPGIADPRLWLALSRAQLAVVLRHAAAVLRCRAHGAGGSVRSGKHSPQSRIMRAAHSWKTICAACATKPRLQELVARVTEITGLPPEVVKAARGRIDEKLFAREFAREQRQAHLVLRSCGVRRRSRSGGSTT